MATKVSTAGAAIVAVVAVGAAIGGLITRDDSAPDNSGATATTTSADEQLDETNSATTPTNDEANGETSEGAAPTTLIPGARMHSELGWTMQIGSEWASGESAEGVSWTFGDQAQVEVITRAADGTLEDHAATLADELETSFDDVSNARAEATTLDDTTPAQRVTAQADAGGTPVGIVIYVVQGGEKFIAAAYVAEQSEFDATAAAVENYLRTLRADA